MPELSNGRACQTKMILAQCVNQYGLVGEFNVDSCYLYKAWY